MHNNQQRRSIALTTDDGTVLIRVVLKLKADRLEHIMKFSATARVITVRHRLVELYPDLRGDKLQLFWFEGGIYLNEGRLLLRYSHGYKGGDGQDDIFTVELRKYKKPLELLMVHHEDGDKELVEVWATTTTYGVLRSLSDKKVKNMYDWTLCVGDQELSLDAKIPPKIKTLTCKKLKVPRFSLELTPRTRTDTPSTGNTELLTSDEESRIKPSNSVHEISFAHANDEGKSQLSESNSPLKPEPRAVADIRTRLAQSPRSVSLSRPKQRPSPRVVDRGSSERTHSESNSPKTARMGKDDPTKPPPTHPKNSTDSSTPVLRRRRSQSFDDISLAQFKSPRSQHRRIVIEDNNSINYNNNNNNNDNIRSSNDKSSSTDNETNPNDTKETSRPERSGEPAKKRLTGKRDPHQSLLDVLSQQQHPSSPLPSPHPNAVQQDSHRSKSPKNSAPNEHRSRTRSEPKTGAMIKANEKTAHISQPNSPDNASEQSSDKKPVLRKSVSNPSKDSEISPMKSNKFSHSTGSTANDTDDEKVNSPEFESQENPQSKKSKKVRVTRTTATNSTTQSSVLSDDSGNENYDDAIARQKQLKTVPAFYKSGGNTPKRQTPSPSGSPYPPTAPASSAISPTKIQISNQPSLSSSLSSLSSSSPPPSSSLSSSTSSLLSSNSSLLSSNSLSSSNSSNVSKLKREKSIGSPFKLTKRFSSFLSMNKTPDKISNSNTSTTARSIIEKEGIIISIEDDGKKIIKAGTTQAIVLQLLDWLLTEGNRKEVFRLVHIFISTYRAFSTPNEVRDLLIEYWKKPRDDNSAEESLSRIRSGIMFFLSGWFEVQFQDFLSDQEFEKSIQAFIDNMPEAFKNPLRSKFSSSKRKFDPTDILFGKSKVSFRPESLGNSESAPNFSSSPRRQSNKEKGGSKGSSIVSSENSENSHGSDEENNHPKFKSKHKSRKSETSLLRFDTSKMISPGNNFSENNSVHNENEEMLSKSRMDDNESIRDRSEEFSHNDSLDSGDNNNNNNTNNNNSSPKHNTPLSSSHGSRMIKKRKIRKGKIDAEDNNEENTANEYYEEEKLDDSISMSRDLEDLPTSKTPSRSPTPTMISRARIPNEHSYEFATLDVMRSSRDNLPESPSKTRNTHRKSAPKRSKTVMETHRRYTSRSDTDDYNDEEFTKQSEHFSDEIHGHSRQGSHSSQRSRPALKRRHQQPLHHPQKLSRFSDISARDLAECWTLLDLQNLMEISRTEFVCDDPNKRVNMMKMLNRSNMLTRWIASEIVRAPKLHDRTELFRRAIEMADIFSDINNFNGLMCVWGALKSTSVSRLTQTRENLPAEALQIYESLSVRLTESRNFTPLQIEIERALFKTEAVVPWFELLAKNRNMINEIPTFIDSHELLQEFDDIKQLFVNFEKMKILGDQILKFDKFQQHNHNFILNLEEYNIDAQLLSLLNDMPVLTDEELWNLSIECESLQSNSAVTATTTSTTIGTNIQASQ